MPLLPSVFNAKDNDKMGFDTVPAGWYKAEVSKSELKNTSAGTGKFLRLFSRITEPEEYVGKTFSTLMNLVNPNPQTVEIAQKELASICEACGIDELEDSTELHEIEYGVRLGLTEGDANWPPKNEVKAYKAANEVEFEAIEFGE